jgi:hypothetical protein
MATVLVRDKAIRPERDPESKAGPDSSTTSVNTIPPLGDAIYQKRFFFQRSKAYDVDAIATQASSLHVARIAVGGRKKGADSRAAQCVRRPRHGKAI